MPTGEGWLYLAVLLDLFSRRIVGWAIRATLETDLVFAAWRRAIGRRDGRHGLIHHSDRGCNTPVIGYQAVLHAHRVRCSMSRRGNCYDNAVVESFFRTLKVELDETVWPTRQAAVRAVSDFIEDFYNTRRLHSTSGLSNTGGVRSAPGRRIMCRGLQ